MYANLYFCEKPHAFGIAFDDETLGYKLGVVMVFNILIIAIYCRASEDILYLSHSFCSMLHFMVFMFLNGYIQPYTSLGVITTFS